MQTSDERREVAARLRGLDVKITSRDTLERAVDKFMKAVCGDIPFSPIRYSVRNLCGLANMIADLIDRPTCRNLGGEEGTNGEHHDFFCSACGYAADVTEPNYCPNCRAEVVDE